MLLQMHAKVLRLIHTALMTLLLFSSATEGEGRCIQEEIQLQQAQSGFVVPVVEMDFLQSARESRAALRGIKFRAGFKDLDDPNKYCQRAGQNVTDLRGSVLTCTEDNILTDAKRSILTNTLLPRAMSLLSDALKTAPGSTFVNSPLMPGLCRNFEATSELKKVADGDFILLVAAAPTPSTITAWGAGCLADWSGKSRVGVINISPAFIDGTASNVRTVVHEILHTLGFTRLGSVPVQMRGKSVNLVTSSKVRAKAAEHYGCPDLEGMEVDDDGKTGTKGSHWKMRTAKDDVMSGYVTAVRFLSPMTLAYMEDTGFYTPDYDKANILPYGHDAGCNFVRKPCVSGGVSAYPQYFPTSNSTRLCTSDYSAVGRVASRNSTCSDKIYDYFGDGKCGSQSALDFCPYYQTEEICPTSDTEWTSRCFNIFDESGAACLNVSCDFDAQTYTVGGVTCAPGERVTVNGAVYRCLHFYEACPYRKTDGLLKPCTPHCKRCTNSVCDSCDEPYILSASNTCESPSFDCTPNCKRCSNNYCVQCEDLYIATPESALCVRKVENCNSISNDGKCISCDGGRKPSGDGSKCVSKGVPWWVWPIVGIAAAVVIVVLIVVVLCCCCGGSAGPDDEDESSYSSQAPSDSCSDSLSESDGSSQSSW